ncbi:MAG: TPM domain-containing protein, partial [Rhodospirillaceae bacterium]|nr:TPM domain-containing protein [Rhodospirillaceae bacterium]
MIVRRAAHPVFARALAVALGLALALLLSAPGGTRAAQPDFPALTGRVVDEAGLLSPEARARLEAQLEAFERKTSDQVVVVTLKSLQGYEIAAYGYQLGRHWGIGQKGRDNGVLLIVAPQERAVRIEVGYGLEGVLTDAVSSSIIRTVLVPAFRSGKFESGIEAAVAAILAAIDGTYQPAEEPADSPAGTWPSLLILLLVAFLVLFVIPFLNRRRGGG